MNERRNPGQSSDDDSPRKGRTNGGSSAPKGPAEEPEIEELDFDAILGDEDLGEAPAPQPTAAEASRYVEEDTPVDELVPLEDLSEQPTPAASEPIEELPLEELLADDLIEEIPESAPAPAADSEAVTLSEAETLPEAEPVAESDLLDAAPDSSEPAKVEEQTAAAPPAAPEPKKKTFGFGKKAKGDTKPGKPLKLGKFGKKAAASEAASGEAEAAPDETQVSPTAEEPAAEAPQEPEPEEKGAKKPKFGKKLKKDSKKPAKETEKPAPTRKPALAGAGQTVTFVCSECYEELLMSTQFSGEVVSCPECLHVGKRPDEEFLRTVQVHKSGERKSLAGAVAAGVLLTVVVLALLYVRSPFYLQQNGAPSDEMTYGLLGGAGILGILLVWLSVRAEGNRWEVYF